MAERPNVLLSLILAAAGLFASFIGAFLVGLGVSGTTGIATLVAGALTACVVFVSQLPRVPVQSLVVVTLAFASVVALARALLAYYREQCLLRALPLVRAEGIARITEEAGAVDAYVTPAERPAAFCFGLFRPRLVVTAGLLKRLDDEERAAAIWHEAYHARMREPLRCLVARLASHTFFWMPALADLLDRYLLVKELAADRVAVERTSTRALAGALLAVAGERTPAGAIGLADAAGARIDRLFDANAPLPPLFRGWSLPVTALSAIALGLLAAFPVEIDLSESSRLRAMLTTMSLHGVPGMTLGLVLNLALLSGFFLLARRLRASGGRARRSNTALD